MKNLNPDLIDVGFHTVFLSFFPPYHSWLYSAYAETLRKPGAAEANEPQRTVVGTHIFEQQSNFRHFTYFALFSQVQPKFLKPKITSWPSIVKSCQHHLHVQSSLGLLHCPMAHYRISSLLEWFLLPIPLASALHCSPHDPHTSQDRWCLCSAHNGFPSLWSLRGDAGWPGCLPCCPGGVPTSPVNLQWPGLHQVLLSSAPIFYTDHTCLPDVRPQSLCTWHFLGL